MLHYRIIHSNVAMGVFLCECTQGVHLSSCLRVLEQRSVVNDALYLVWFVHKPLLEVGLVQVLDVLLAFHSVGLCRPLRERCSYQGLEIISDDATGPEHECSTTPIGSLKLIFELLA